MEWKLWGPPRFPAPPKELRTVITETHPSKMARKTRSGDSAKIPYIEGDVWLADISFPILQISGRIGRIDYPRIFMNWRQL